MICGYTLPNAEKLITTGVKIHTLRNDKVNRWKVGFTIQHATGVRSKNYNCFHENKVISVQQILIVLLEDADGPKMSVTVDRRRLTQEKVELLARNDGFENAKEMCKWFFGAGSYTMWAGKIIHWTKLKY